MGFGPAGMPPHHKPIQWLISKYILFFFTAHGISYSLPVAGVRRTEKSPKTKGTVGHFLWKSSRPTWAAESRESPAWVGVRSSAMALSQLWVLLHLLPFLLSNCLNKARNKKNTKGVWTVLFSCIIKTHLFFTNSLLINMLILFCNESQCNSLGSMYNLGITQMKQ